MRGCLPQASCAREPLVVAGMLLGSSAADGNRAAQARVHIAYISADANHPPDKYWDAWYAYLTDKHGLSPKPGFIGMSRGGQFALRWATTHPDKVSCIYADNPGGDDGIFRGLLDLARNDVPLFLLVGTNDPCCRATPDRSKPFISSMVVGFP